MPYLRLILFAVVVIAIIIFLVDRHRSRRCPVCGSNRIKEMDRTTDKIELDKRSIPGIGSKVNVTATVSFRCYTCGHAWQQQEHN